MSMIEVKTADLIGPSLDWAVAKADGHDPLVVPTGRDEYSVCVILAMDDGPKGFACRYSTDWGQGGPLIEKYQIAYLRDGEDYVAVISRMEQEGFGSGSSHLVAACRAIVSAKLGDVVQVPAELVGGV